MNKKTFVFPLIALSCFALTSCRSEKEASEADKDASSYDLSQNKETVAYFGDSVNCDMFSIQICFEKQSGFVITNKNLKLALETNSFEKQIDLVEAYLCDGYGNNVKNLITKPKRFICDYEGTYKSYMYFDNIGSDIINNFDDNSYLNLNHLENPTLRLLFDGITITYNLWNKPDYCSTINKNKEDFTASTDEAISGLFDDNIKGKTCNFKMHSFIGAKWIEDSIRLTGTSYNEFDTKIIDAYLTNYNNEDKLNILEKPINFHNTSKDSVSYEFKGEFAEYFKKYDNKVNVYVITTNENMLFRSYCIIENCKNKDDYSIQNNFIKHDYTDSYYEYNVKHNKASALYFNGNEVSFYERTKVSFTGDNTLDVVEMYFSDTEGNNKQYLISNPVTIYFYSNGECNLYFDIDFDGAEYLERVSKKVELRIITENMNYFFHFYKNPNPTTFSL